jgi:hypothetical protein
MTYRHQFLVLSLGSTPSLGGITEGLDRRQFLVGSISFLGGTTEGLDRSVRHFYQARWLSGPA